MLKQKPMSVRDSRYRRSRWGQSSRLLKSLLRRNCEKNVFVLILGWKRRGLIGDDDVKFWMNRNMGNEMIAPKTVNDQSEYVKRNKANAGNLSPQRLALQRFALPRKRHTLPYRGNVSYVALSRTEQTAMGEYLGNVYDWRVRVKRPVYVVFGWRTSGGRVSYSRDKVMCKKMSSIAHWSFFSLQKWRYYTVQCVSIKTCQFWQTVSFAKHGLILITFGEQHQHAFKNAAAVQLFLFLHFYLFYLLLNSSNGNGAFLEP